MNDDPYKLPVAEILDKAFEVGMNAIDTSPYYGPSEELIGEALLKLQDKYKREDYILMTKAGRIALNKFNYSKEWIQSSVERSLKRMNTSYLDLVYCHDIEFVSEEELLEGVGTLYELKKRGLIHNVGISGYHPSVLSRAILKIKETLGFVPDAVQNYAHFTIQNTQLAGYLDQWQFLGVKCVLTSSPLNMGLLSGKSAPDFHPAPKELRKKVLEAAEFIQAKYGMTMPEAALRFTIGKWNELSDKNGGGCVISGISFMNELDTLLNVYSELMAAPEGAKPVGNRYQLNKEALRKYEPMFKEVEEKFGDLYDYEWMSPPEGFKRE
ncbi:hypothetical protein TRVA0_069S00166 [Trichomonascus vanleenenianus]|uniref:uncharacterized protein n=1 Tax=Trichomonascus vanleenenianus TaxID=2268995 RepID=UPI003EC9B7D8